MSQSTTAKNTNDRGNTTRHSWTKCLRHEAIPIGARVSNETS